MSTSSVVGPGSRFAIRVDRIFGWLFTLLGAPKAFDVVVVDDRRVRVHLAWMFRATIDRSAIVAVRHHRNMYGGWGAHGFRGRWLVNGSSAGIVELQLSPRQRAFVMGFPVRLDTLWVSLEDPDRFIDLLGGESGAPTS